MNTREMKQVRKQAAMAVTGIEAQIKKLNDNLKTAKEHLKGVDALIGSAQTTKAAVKPVKPAKVAKAKPEKVAKAPKAAAAKAAAPKAAKPAKAPKAAKPAKGDRPPLREAICKVMGNKTMNAEAVLAALKEKGWEPHAQNQKGYVAYMLSSNKETFTRVQEKGRGFYKRIVEAKAPEAKAPEADPKPETKAPAKPKNNKDEKVLADLGVNANAVAANPFRS